VPRFDVRRLYADLDAERSARGLSWQGLADDVWELSAGLNARRDDHPISPATLRWSTTRHGVGCHHALFMLRWLGRSPEDYVAGAAVTAMPDPGPDRRLRWDLPALAAALDERRRAEGLTWPEAAVLLHTTPAQLSGLRRVRFGVGMQVTMPIVQWLGRASTDFIVAAQW
jgi:hypothetical protein